jgi:hypothetical protein
LTNYIDNSNIIDLNVVENTVVVSDTGLAGPRGNSILNGVGAPNATTPANAVEGDFYLDIGTDSYGRPKYHLYGPRTYDGQWGGYIDLFTLPESFFVHNQSSASNTWTINHGLGYRPNVTVVDNNETQVEGDVQYQNDNTVIIRFVAEFSGKAYLS